MWDIGMLDHRVLVLRLCMVASLELLSEHPKCQRKAVYCGRRGRWAPGDIEVDRDELVGSTPDAVQVMEDAAGTTACSVSHADLGIGRGMVGAQRWHAHRTRHGSRIHQHIRVPRRGDHLDTKALHIEDWCQRREDLDLTTVA